MFHVVNKVVLSDQTVEVSTVDLSVPEAGIVGKGFETCLFFENGESEVVEWYSTIDRAIAGHAVWNRPPVISYVLTALAADRWPIQRTEGSEDEPLADWERELLAQSDWKGSK
jgi:hypothetical protein